MNIIVIIITIIICRDPPRRPSGPRPAPAVLETGRASTKILHAFKLWWKLKRRWYQAIGIENSTKKLTPQDIQQEASGIKRRTSVKKKGLDERLGDASFLRPSGGGEDFGSSDTDFWLKSLRWLIQKKPSIKFKRPGLRVGGKEMEKFRAFSVKGGGFACHKAFFLPKSTY